MKKFYLLLAIIFNFSCIDQNQSSKSSNEKLTVTFKDSPISLNNQNVKFAEDISYDSKQRTKLDIFVPESTEPTPLVIYFHGGGFTSGDKSKLQSSSNLVNFFMDNNIAVAAVNYTYVSQGINTLLEPLNDSKRALQFLRYHKKVFNINSSRIILMGSSAGAGTSLWIGLQDEMASSNSKDPIQKESTRVLGIIAEETQATYDFEHWPIIFSDYSTSLSDLESYAIKYYKISSLAELSKPEIQQLADSLDMFSFLDSDDPEIWLSNENIDNVAPSTSSILLHHPLHGKFLKERSESVGHTGSFYIPGIDSTPPSESMSNFILRILN